MPLLLFILFFVGSYIIGWYMSTIGYASDPHKDTFIGRIVDGIIPMIAVCMIGIALLVCTVATFSQVPVGS